VLPKSPERGFIPQDAAQLRTDLAWNRFPNSIWPFTTMKTLSFVLLLVALESLLRSPRPHCRQPVRNMLVSRRSGSIACTRHPELYRRGQARRRDRRHCARRKIADFTTYGYRDLENTNADDGGHHCPGLSMSKVITSGRSFSSSRRAGSV